MNKLKNIPKTKWQELGRYFQGYFRLEKDGSLYLHAQIRSLEEIPFLCQALSQKLGYEYEVICEKKKKNSNLDLGA